MPERNQIAMMDVACLPVLILETSGRVGQVALAEGVRVLHCRRLDEARRHARDLVPALAELLALQGWQPKDIQAMLVSRGPGSYTGLRVGTISAKTFAYATGCRLLAVESFAAIARQAPAEAERVEVLADAQQEKVYVQGFQRVAPAEWSAVSPLRIEPFPDWLRQASPGSWVTGPGLRLYQRRLPASALVAPEEAWDPQPASVLQLGLERYEAGEQDDLWNLEPLYVRPSSAEEKWQGR